MVKSSVKTKYTIYDEDIYITAEGSGSISYPTGVEISRTSWS
jgi:hypothetical protein